MRIKNIKYKNITVGIIVISALAVGVYFYLSKGNEQSDDISTSRSIPELSDSDTSSSPKEIFGSVNSEQVPSTSSGQVSRIENWTSTVQHSDTSADKMPDGWSEYRSERYGFSLFYPLEMTAGEFDEGGGASTLTFEDKDDARGFQIFAVPYSGTHVTEERFLRDVPSGVRKDPVDFYIGGTLATAFYSTHPLLGDMVEVWFIHEGYLFELTTLQPLENLLAEVIQTLRFQ